MLKGNSTPYSLTLIGFCNEPSNKSALEFATVNPSKRTYLALLILLFARIMRNGVDLLQDQPRSYSYPYPQKLPCQSLRGARAEIEHPVAVGSSRLMARLHSATGRDHRPSASTRSWLADTRQGPEVWGSTSRPKRVTRGTPVIYMQSLALFTGKRIPAPARAGSRS